MYSKLFILNIVIIVFSSTVILFTVEVSSAEPIRLVQNITPKEQVSISTVQENHGLPIRLNIPKINISADLEYVSLTPDGAMDVPKGHSNVAWFQLGPRPGEKGNSVINGHYGLWGNGARAVFNDLNKLQKGDKIYIEDETGNIVTFVVREIKPYSKDEKVQDIFGPSDESHLNLITCEGNWSKAEKSYSDRLVVFSDKKTK